MSKLEATSYAPAQVDVAIIGAGISGIAMGYHLNKIPGLSYLILDKASDLGGTWNTFHYPGLRSDSDIDSYCFSFESWTGSRPLGLGSEIQDYLRSTAKKHHIFEHMRFGAKVISANFDSETQRWTLVVVSDGAEYEVVAKHLHCAAGYFDHDASHQPTLPNESDFGGPIIDPQFWPEDLDWTAKKVTIIGSGATAVTLVPELAQKAAKVTMLQRTVNHTAVMPNTDPLKKLRAVAPRRAVDKLDRWRAIGMQSAVLKASELAEEWVKKTLAKHRTEIIDAKTHAEHFEADYPLWTQRLCRVPDGDLFHGVASGAIEVVTDRIAKLEPKGILTESGRFIESDIIVSATGLKLLSMGGVKLSCDGNEINPGQKIAYRGMCLNDVPNFSFTLGYVNDSFTLRAELVAQYLVRMLVHMRANGYATFTPINPPGGDRYRIIDLQSNYVNRGIAQFPEVTGTAPWTLWNNYLREVRDFRSTDPTVDVLFDVPRSSAVPTSISAQCSTAKLGAPRLVETQHGSIRVQRSGTEEATPLVMIHGIGRGLDDFDALTTQLAERFDILAIDIPGFGETKALAGGESESNPIAPILDAMWEVIDAEFATKQVVLLGHSLGGAIVQRMLTAHPERVSKLILMAPSGFSSEITPIVKAAALPKVGEKLMNVSNDKVLLAMEKATVHDASVLGEDHVDVAKRRLAHPDRARTFAAISRALVQTPSAQRMSAARACASVAITNEIPVLAIWGTEDKVIGIDQLSALRELYPNAQVEVLPGCGHMPQIEKTAAVATAVLGFA